MCENVEHKLHIDKLYKSVIRILSESAVATCCRGISGKRNYVTGWNKYVKEAHAEARYRFLLWVQNGKPSSGMTYTQMCESRKAFKAKLKWCQNNERKIKMDIIASHHVNGSFGSFWREVNRLSPRSSLPSNVEGKKEPVDIANQFLEHFKISSPLDPSTRAHCYDVSGPEVRFSARDIAAVVKNMARGKSPGHDSLSIEHVQNAGVHLPRILALLFNLCLSHSYLPAEMMKTIVTPIPKNKTGDLSNINNYRPISLATIAAKILDSLLNSCLNKQVHLNDRQFGFRNGLSTDTAIMTLKSTVQYYTGRKTPVYACFLDLSRAFDLVRYDLLWNKLAREVKLPPELIKIFQYWYGN